MSLLNVVTFLTLPSSTLGPSPGTQLAQVVQNVYADPSETVDLCIMFDSPNTVWRDFLDDFGANTPPNFAVTRLDWIGFVRTKFDLHLIFLDSAMNSASFNKMAHFLLAAQNWNRYGKFVFVAVNDKNFKVKLFDSYCTLVRSLGVTNSVLYFLAEGGAMIMQYDYFKGRPNIFRSVEDIGVVLKTDFSLNMQGFNFYALFIVQKPFLFIDQFNNVGGIHLMMVVDFCKHVNASIQVKVPKHQFPTREQFSEHVQGGYISFVNGITMVPKFTDLEYTGSQSGLCLIIPERIVGSILQYLLRPYNPSLFVFIVVAIILLFIISSILPKVFPRGILNQLLYGFLIDEYKMARIERFTLFSLTVILFLLCESYLAKLFQYLLNNQYEPHLETVEDLHASNYTIYTESQYHLTHVETLFPQLKNRIQLLLDGNYFTNPDPYKVIWTYCRFATSATLSDENFDQKSRLSKYYVLPERAPLLTDAFTHSRLQPFSLRFMEIYARLNEAGLSGYWFRVDTAKWLALVASELKVVQFDHLFSLWKLLATCYGIGSVVFIGEVMTKLVLEKFAKKTARSRISNAWKK